MSNDHDTTEIAFILDRSGSMDSVTESAISGFNQFLREQQKDEGAARLTLVLFDDEILVPADNLPICELIQLDTNSYVPRGSTALLDAIGKTIKRFRKRIKNTAKKNRPDNIIFAILTDGFENSSRKYSWDKISKMIRKRTKKDGWEFLFLGANQDAIATAAKINIGAHNSASFAASDSGVYSSQQAISRRVKALRKANLYPESVDLVSSMEDILREESENDDQG